MTIACAVCSGASDAAVAPAVNASIGLLLCVLVFVGACFFRFLLYLARHDGIGPRGGEAEFGNGPANNGN